MKVRARYSATVGGTTVTLGPKVGREDEDTGGDPLVFGTGNIVITTAGTPSAQFWKGSATGAEYLVEISRVN